VTLHSYLVFAVACFVLAIMPGPDMIYMLGRCVTQGRKAGLMAAIGFNLGGYAHLSAAMLGLSAVIATSIAAFTIIKWLGAGYLIYIGIDTLRGRRATIGIETQSVTGPRAKAILWQAFLSDVLNPKVAMFFLALLPQFVDASAPHATIQIFVLGVTLNMIALACNMLVVTLSASVTTSLRRNTALAAWLQRALGATFLALGLRLAVEKN